MNTKKLIPFFLGAAVVAPLFLSSPAQAQSVEYIQRLEEQVQRAKEHGDFGAASDLERQLNQARLQYQRSRGMGEVGDNPYGYTGYNPNNGYYNPNQGYYPTQGYNPNTGYYPGNGSYYPTQGYYPNQGAYNPNGGYWNNGQYVNNNNNNNRNRNNRNNRQGYYDQSGRWHRN